MANKENAFTDWARGHFIPFQSFRPFAQPQLCDFKGQGAEEDPGERFRLTGLGVIPRKPLSGNAPASLEGLEVGGKMEAPLLLRFSFTFGSNRQPPLS